MGQDLREMLKNDQESDLKLSEGHEARFAKKLKASFSENTSEKKTDAFFWMKIAAMIVVFLGVGYMSYKAFSEEEQIVIADTETEETSEAPQFTLGDLSPDLKKVEEFYLKGIDVQLSSLEVNDDNKELIEGYMKRLEALNKEYQLLSKELNEVGPTEETINALIDNLKLRLELLFKLKNKLKELKNIENEKFNEMAV